MLRKLTVTLAGSAVSDPYLQILSAQLIMLVSAIATAYVQPYETGWLNLLDIAGLFALILTQVLSILYFYAETATYPFMEPQALEVLVTTMLFLLNAFTVLGFVVAYVSEASSARETCQMRGKVQLKIVDDEARVLHALSAASGERAAKPARPTLLTPEPWWAEERVQVGANVMHPTRGRGKVIAVSPDDDQRVHVEFAVLGDVHRYDHASWSIFVSMQDLFASALAGIDDHAEGSREECGTVRNDAGGDEGSEEDAIKPSSVDALGSAAEAAPLLWRHPAGVAVEDAPTKMHDARGSVVWLYSDPTLAVSAATPELLIAVTESAPLAHGDRYRWVHPQTRSLSAPHVELIDVGGCPERVLAENDGEDVVEVNGGATHEMLFAPAEFELQLMESRDSCTGVDLSLEMNGAHGVDLSAETAIDHQESDRRNKGVDERSQEGMVLTANPLVRARPISLVGSPIANV